MDVFSHVSQTMRRRTLVALLLVLWWSGLFLYLSSQPPADQETQVLNDHTARMVFQELRHQEQQDNNLLDFVQRLRENQTLKEELLKKKIKMQTEELKRVKNQLAKLQADQGKKPFNYEQEHEQRKAENSVRELWYFLNSELNSNLSTESIRVSGLMKKLEGYRRTITDDFAELRQANQAEQWRRQRSEELGDLVQRRLEFLQNPENCSAVRVAVCDLNKECGFGCQLHHVTYCMIVAYATERTLVLKSEGWVYDHRGWESVFEPLSRTCTQESLPQRDNSTSWLESEETMRPYSILYLPLVDKLPRLHDFMPLAVPADLLPELSLFHGAPAAWWVGQMVRYLFRLRSDLLEEVLRLGWQMGFHDTVVGIQVRRTDKVLSEASYHSLDEYMRHVHDFYHQLQRSQPNVTRRVYIASDDPSVHTTAREQYPEYVFMGDSNISRTAQLNSRYSVMSLHGVITDVFYLARCQFLVCTFSSQVCRLAYELMQTLNGDASDQFRSLDDVYYFGGQLEHLVEVLEADQSNTPGYLSIEPGDLIGLAGNHWNGYSKGFNHRTKTVGLFPSYKTRNVLRSVRLPTYPQVPTR